MYSSTADRHRTQEGTPADGPDLSQNGYGVLLLLLLLLLLLFRTRAEVSRMCMITNAVLIGMGALDGKELFAIKGSEKLALNSRTTRRSAKNAEKTPKTPSSPPYPP